MSCSRRRHLITLLPLDDHVPIYAPLINPDFWGEVRFRAAPGTRDPLAHDFCACTALAHASLCFVAVFYHHVGLSTFLHHRGFRQPPPHVAPSITMLVSKSKIRSCLDAQIGMYNWNNFILYRIETILAVWYPRLPPQCPRSTTKIISSRLHVAPFLLRNFALSWLGCTRVRP
jgi:hypothetical protein